MSLKILMATSEATPLAKTGGLADVCGALPQELAKLGHQATVVLPAYRQVFESGLPIEPTGVHFTIPIGAKRVPGTLLKTSLGGGQVPVYLVQQDSYYLRPDLYRDGGQDYRDNCERFVFFSRAVLEAIRLLRLDIDVIHANDWQTGLVPAYLKLEYSDVLGFDRIGSLFTIHNMAYQGVFWHWDMLLTGLDWKYFNYQQLEFYGNLNLLKTGLVFADRLNTVSPRYAEEIQSAPLGCGLEGVLQQRQAVLSGIINGVDYDEWNPATDANLPVPFGADDPWAGKAAAKQALQTEMGLPTKPDVPLIVFVGRLAEQKGVDLILSVLREWAPTQDAQWVFLGTGDAGTQEMLEQQARRFPQKVAARFEFSNALAHKIEAGADMFLMPSRYEPCGLNQLYSLRYGTIPIVRSTGGLADTVVDQQEVATHGHAPTGFVFHDFAPHALAEAIRRACDTFAQPDLWRKLMINGMRQDWSWRHSAQEYVDLYERIAAIRRVGASK
jgi:starch synthase